MLVTSLKKSALSRNKENDMSITTMCVQSDRTFVAAIPVSQLKHLYVSTFDSSDPDSPAPSNHGYQRNPDPKRYVGISKYYRQEGNAALVTPIIISARVTDDGIDDLLSMLRAEDFPAIHKKYGKAVLSVVDGQHRIGGLSRANQQDPKFNPLIPCAIYFGMTYKAEAQLFDDININQKNLPKALVEVTAHLVTNVGDETYEQRVRDVAWNLSQNKSSPFYNRVNLTGGRDPQRRVTYEGIRRSTSVMLTRDVLKRVDGAQVKDIYKLIEMYWLGVAKASPKAWEASALVLDPMTKKLKPAPTKYRIRELVGVASLARLGRDIILTALDRRGDGNKTIGDTVQDMTAKLAKVDWEKTDVNPWMASQAGFAGQKELYGMLVDLVYNNIEL